MSCAWPSQPELQSRQAPVHRNPHPDALPAEVAEKIGFVNNFKGLSMIGVSIVGIFLAVVHFKNSQKVAVAAPSTPSESGEIEDDEF